MSKGSEAVKKWRYNTKIRMVEAMGHKCQICGYDKCVEALEFHHLNPEEKEYGLGGIRANPKSWTKITQELKKCILVCNRCHSEIHYNIVKVPENFQNFNNEYENYLEKQKEEMFDSCPICGKKKNFHQKTCSYTCAAKLSWTIDWSRIDLKQKLLEGLSFVKIAEEVGCSDITIKKRCKKLGIDHLNKFRK